jgi:predicted ATPase
LVLEAYSVSHGKATAYLPVIELLKSYFDIQSRDDERKRREKITGKVLNLDRSLEDTLPYLFALLGIEEQPSPLQQMDAQIRRRRTFEALKKLFLRESLNQPLVLIFEDLHWIDEETQGVLDVLSESVASAKLLLLTNYRPEYRHEWGQKTYYTQLRLAPLGNAEAEEFLDVLLGIPVGADCRVGPQEGAHRGAPLHDLKQLILDKTQGTPFFMEEIVQDLFEQGVLVRTEVGAVRRDRPQEGAHTSAPLQIPPTVQGVLAARIDRLAPDEKALLQQLSVIGREFPLGLIRQVITQPEADLYRLLASLQRKEFLYEQPAFPEVEYIFKHALTQEVAYGTVLQEQRKFLHERTGQALETVYAATLQEHYSDLAHHYRRSANTEKAITYLQLVGQQAVQRSANTEAITHFSTALELLQTLADTPERTRQEIDLQAGLGLALMATRGYAAPEVGKAYTRAWELAQQAGETSRLFPMLWGLSVFYLVQEQFQKGRELAEQMLTLAQHAQDPAPLLEAHTVLGNMLYCLGEFVSAREHLEQGLALYDSRRHGALAFLYGGGDPGMTCLAEVAWTLWMLGYPDQSLQKSRAAITLAQELSHPQSLAFALCFAAELHQFRGEAQAVQERAETAIALCTEQGLPFWLARGIFERGWVLVEQGLRKEGIAQMRQGLAAFWETGANLWRSCHLGLLAEAYGKVGQIAEGLATVVEAIDWAHSTGGLYYEAELYRIKGALTLESQVASHKSQVPNTQHPTPSTQAEAEACFLKAIEISCKQQAKSLELRATVSLARFWQQQGKQQEAHSMLSEIYNWFTEGFDTKDLQEAKTLIEELSHL